MPELPALLDGDLVTPQHPDYDTARRPVHVVRPDQYPKYVVRCRSVADVVAAVRFARERGEHAAVRSGGHCFAGRSSTDGVVVDLHGLGTIDVARDGVATVGAGARLGPVYSALHAHGRTLPAGCGATVGIAGLTLGGGIGLLGRRYGLTCDRLVGAQVVLADGDVIDCDAEHDAELFWGLRGAGGGQFAVVTSLRFETVPEPLATGIAMYRTGLDPGELIEAWQGWAPDAPDETTVGLTVAAGPGGRLVASLVGASLLGRTATHDLVQDLVSRVGTGGTPVVHGEVPYHRLKNDLHDPRDRPGCRLRSEFFSSPLRAETIGQLLALLDGSPQRRLTFTPMGGAYNRVAPDATAFAHRGERFLLEHVGAVDDLWVDTSWSTARSDGSGRVYPNFPDPALGNWATAYHGGNYARLVSVKDTYDPDGFFDFAQAIQPTERYA